MLKVKKLIAFSLVLMMAAVFTPAGVFAINENEGNDSAITEDIDQNQGIELQETDEEDDTEISDSTAETDKDGYLVIEVEGGLLYFDPDNNSIVHAKDNSSSDIITELEIPSTVTDEEENSYDVEKIEDDAFAECERLSKITLPSTITSIDPYAFDGCKSLTSITVEEGNPTYFSKSGVLFKNFEEDEYYSDDLDYWQDGKHYILVKYPANRSGSTYSLPKYTEGIVDDAFDEASNLTTINLAAETHVRGWAFGNCPKLTAVNANGNSNYETKSGILFYVGYVEDDIASEYNSSGDDSDDYSDDDEWWDDDWWYDDDYEGDTQTGSLVYYPSGKTASSYTVYKYTESIGEVDGILTGAFYSANLKKVILSEYISSISEAAFDWCEKLENIEVTKDNEYFYSKSGVLFSYDYYDEETDTWYENGVLFRCPEGKKLTKYTIPVGTKAVSCWAFFKCKKIDEIVVSEGVEVLERGAFANTEFRTIYLPKSLYEIRIACFEGISESPKGLPDIYYTGSEDDWDDIDIVIDKDGEDVGNIELNNCTIIYDYVAPIASATTASASYTYNGKVRTPSVTVRDMMGAKLSAGEDYTVKLASGRKNVGKYLVTVTGINDYDEQSANTSFTIIPKGTSIKTPVKAKKAFTVKWSKQSAKMSKSRITGYQIQYSTSSSFSGAKTVTVKGYKKTSKKISKLKSKKKYYVRVRTYLKTGGTTYYSAWSKKKSVKTK